MRTKHWTTLAGLVYSGFGFLLWIVCPSQLCDKETGQVGPYICIFFLFLALWNAITFDKREEARDAARKASKKGVIKALAESGIHITEEELADMAFESESLDEMIAKVRSRRAKDDRERR